MELGEMTGEFERTVGYKINPQTEQMTPIKSFDGDNASWGKSFNYKHGGEMSTIEHINYRHSYNTGFSNVSKFSEGTSVKMIKGYVDQAIRYGNPIKGGYEYNFGKVIGTGSNGAPAMSIRVFIRDGWVKTAFPF
ncbi:hypothetical protein [Chryseobacterium gossypii]|uniref:hypothetical protein n=1 Tax=Chryseobacterium gossypii TaxID=3231602 RepID=UPI0035239409